MFFRFNSSLKILLKIASTRSALLMKKDTNMEASSSSDLKEEATLFISFQMMKEYQ